MDVRKKLVEIVCDVMESDGCIGHCNHSPCFEVERVVNALIDNGVTVQEWINSEEMLPEFPCLALYANGDYVFIPDGILTIKDKHGEWCIDTALAKGIRLIDGTKAETLLWKNRIAYWMPLPKLPKPPKGE